MLFQHNTLEDAIPKLFDLIQRYGELLPEKIFEFLTREFKVEKRFFKYIPYKTVIFSAKKLKDE